MNISSNNHVIKGVQLPIKKINQIAAVAGQTASNAKLLHEKGASTTNINFP